MGIFDKIFKKKNKDLMTEPLLPVEKVSSPLPLETQQIDPTKSIIEGVRVKLDLVLTEIDNLKIQNQMINERLKSIERKLEEKPIRYV